MDAHLEAQIEDIAALAHAIHKDHARLEATLNGALDHLTTVATSLTEAVQSLTEVPDRLAQIAETMMRRASTFVGYVRWFPWKRSCAIGGVLVVALLTINLLWIDQYSAAQTQKGETLEQYRALAVELDRHLMETLYQQLSPAQRGRLNEVYRRVKGAPPSKRKKQDRNEARSLFPCAQPTVCPFFNPCFVT